MTHADVASRWKTDVRKKARTRTTLPPYWASINSQHTLASPTFRYCGGRGFYGYWKGRTKGAGGLKGVLQVEVKTVVEVADGVGVWIGVYGDAEYSRPVWQPVW